MSIKFPKINVQGLLRTAIGHTRKHTPLIITATAIGGVVSTAVLAAKAGARIRERFDFSDAPEEQPARTFHYVNTTWKYWGPTVLSGGLTIASICMIHRTHQKRYAALMGLYALGNQAFQEYRESVDEVIDEKGKDRVKRRAAEKAVHRDEEALAEGLNDIKDLTLCYDTFSGRFFRSDIETIRRAENDFNKGLISHDYGSLNEFYALIGLGGVDAGEDVGWNSNKLLSIGYNSLLTNSGVPALSIDFYDSRPDHDYYSKF